MTARTEMHRPQAGARATPLWHWVTLVAVFAVGAWQGYGFGTRIAGPVAGPWLGVLTGLNLGVMAALAASSLGQSMGRSMEHWRTGRRRS